MAQESREALHHAYLYEMQMFRSFDLGLAKIPEESVDNKLEGL